ncbi:MAG: cob(I)yrinic acid a,c-diamide adenosyltransferase [Desulfurella sp.]|jgi:cob(I)alamin adenosyltransferase|uniref:corrinoid adenosyltransferase n=1 Tax=Desulfurella multipotens TaxID=79269 RepID=A0A1G6I283_9BACT|nr:cob(I)yrinic acid a,c-diamide adenosyltransferase [Desulfurella multipotens]AHF97420.1 cobinamide adenolsyltransferase [Desulfurella acetivorans A63]PMP68317.1 MAG: cob(I)yrinic acid a,c-diamide adenosyltransferase [Desulfurella multipotens]SDC00493.1 cob(I)alamin adenosyltransferase [Desulfurella multipotens]
MKEKGYVQVYTGNGKGKTTAAIGLTIRALGAGLKVLFVQFVKGLPYSEHKALSRFENLTIKQFGRPEFIHSKPSDEDIKAAKDGYNYVMDIFTNSPNLFDVVVLDEANIAVFFGLFSDDELIELIDKKPQNTELIITGRYATQKVIDRADLVTEMKEIKHYYTQGVIARDGIEK